MTPEQFCYWLQGFAELSGGCPPTPEQWKSICEHIATVFKKVTPPVLDNKTRIANPLDAYNEFLRRNPPKESDTPKWHNPGDIICAAKAQ